MDKAQAFAVWKAIVRHHSFFKSGGTFGFDWRTFNVVDPHACAILRDAVERAS